MIGQNAESQDFLSTDAQADCSFAGIQPLGEHLAGAPETIHLFKKLLIQKISLFPPKRGTQLISTTIIRNIVCACICFFQWFTI